MQRLRRALSGKRAPAGQAPTGDLETPRAVMGGPEQPWAIPLNIGERGLSEVGA